MGRTLLLCGCKTRVSSCWGFTTRELSKTGFHQNQVSKVKFDSLLQTVQKRAMSSKWDSTFSFVKEHGFSFFFCQELGKSLFYCQGFRKPPFSVSRLWKISLLDCQVLWVQYRLGLHLRSTSTVLYVYPLGSTLKNKVTTSLR